MVMVFEYEGENFEMEKIIQCCLDHFKFDHAEQIAMRDGIFWRFEEGVREPSADEFREMGERLLLEAIKLYDKRKNSLKSDRGGQPSNVESGGMEASCNDKRIRLLLRLASGSIVLSSTAYLDGHYYDEEMKLCRL